MNTITFGTLQFANKLKAVGFTDEQAQVIIELQLAASRHLKKEIDALVHRQNV